MVLKLSAALVLLFLSRILIYLFNLPQFSDISKSHLIALFFFGLRFDLLTIAVFNTPFVLISSLPFAFRFSRVAQICANVVFVVFNTVAMSANFIDSIYFRYTQKRMTFDIFSYTGQNRKEILSLIPEFLSDFWFCFALWLIAVGILIWVTTLFRVDRNRSRKYRWSNSLTDSIILVVIAGLLVIAARGGVQDKPVSIINAGEYTQPRYFPIILNTPFTIIKTKDEASVMAKEYFPASRSAQVFTPVNTFSGDTGAFTKPDVVIIILESFSAEYSGFLNPELENGHYKGYTPFLDSLMRQSLTFKGFANGEKSIDGIPAVISGIPSLMESPFILSPYASNEINSIGTILKEQGYSTAFFHGGTNGTMGFEAYTKIAGFDDYYGRNEFGNDEYFDGNWGIFDEEFLQFTAQKTNRMKEPFLSVVFTLSSHHPFTIPEKYHGRFPKGHQSIHESIGYADFALSKFFETVSRMPWFERTLFILTADHTYTGEHPFFKKMVGRYMVPIIFFRQNKIQPELGQFTVQHTDILPSVLDYLNFNCSCIAFGTSIFDPTNKRFAVSYNNKTYQLIQNNFVYQFNGENGISLYDYPRDMRLAQNLIRTRTEKAAEMDSLVKAIIQEYHERMINNKLKIRN